MLVADALLRLANNHPCFLALVTPAKKRSKRAHSVWTKQKLPTTNDAFPLKSGFNFNWIVFQKTQVALNAFQLGAAEWTLFKYSFKRFFTQRFPFTR